MGRERSKYLRRVLLLVPVALLLVAVGALTGCATGAKVTVGGSTSVQPLAEKLAEAFKKDNPEVRFDILGGGSSVGVTSADTGAVDIGMCSRELKSGEPDLVKHLLARDGIAIVVHPSNAVTDLTLEQVKDIFAGEIKNWEEVGGADKSITVIAREEGSGTRGAFDELVMKGSLVKPDALLQPSNGGIMMTVSTTEESIGFLSFGFLDDSLVKPLSIDGVAATEANAKSGVYPVVRPLYFLTKEQPAGLVKEFIDFCLGTEGQKIITEQGYIAVK